MHLIGFSVFVNTTLCDFIEVEIWRLLQSGSHRIWWEAQLTPAVAAAAAMAAMRGRRRGLLVLFRFEF